MKTTRSLYQHAKKKNAPQKAGTYVYIPCQCENVVGLIPMLANSLIFSVGVFAVRESIIVGSGVRPPPFLFYLHPFYKCALYTKNSEPPPF